MKFARQLRQLERDCAVQWRGKFIKYKELKKLIKKCRNDAQGCSVDQVEANDAKFFKQLETEVKAVNRNFQKAAMEVLAASKRHQKRTAAGCLSFLKKPKPLDELSAAELSAASAWCRQYAIVNAAGLRKIAKKHDKYCGGSAGSRFLQSCWDSGHLQWGSFLHSPLMDELVALEEILNRQVAQEGGGARRPRLSLPHDDTAVHGAAQDSGAQARVASPDVRMADDASDAAQEGKAGRVTSPSPPLSELSPTEAELHDDSMMCPICLEPMYMPLGLTCGHKACTDCILHATGLAHIHGTLKAILSLAPRTATCPQCRQTGVFENAMLMKKLGAAIESRYPDEIQERRKEAAQQKQLWTKPDWFDKASNLLAPFAPGL